MLPRIAQVECDGFKYLIFSTPDLISKAIFEKGTWEPHISAVAKEFLKGFRDFDVIDIGANLGLFTVPIASLIAPANGRVISFEPQRSIFHQLCGNVFLNRLDNVLCNHCAVGINDGEIQIPEIDYNKMANIGGFSFNEDYMKKQGFGDAVDQSKTNTIKTLKLDSVKTDNIVRLVKIDVEGFEIEVLKGAHNFLEANKFPPIIFEAWGTSWFKDQKQELFDEFTALGYKIDNLSKMEFVAQHWKNDVKIDFSTSHDNVIKLTRIQ